MEKEIILNSQGEIETGVDNFTTGLRKYLEVLDLPTSKVLVPVGERSRVIKNLPDVIMLIDDSKRKKSIYLSKFIAACGAGLFDAALNFIWDETVTNLRQKVIRFDLEYFYNSVISDPKRRKKLKGAEDLEKIDDWELVKGCQNAGILSDIGFKHLEYIRTMRNWASAAHPNQNELTGLQLVSWLETCIKEVIAKEPEGHVLEIKKFLNSIRNTTLEENDAQHIRKGIEHLPTDLCYSLLRNIFGMYTDEDSSMQVKNNIKLIAKTAWNVADEEAKYECGLKYSTFAINGEVNRKNAADEFLKIVGGLSYLTDDTLAVEMSEKISNLYQAHTGYNNFYTEPAHAKTLHDYVSSTGKVPNAVRKQYVKTLVMAKIGNGYGVANMAVEYYDNMIEKFREQEFKETALLLFNKEFSYRILSKQCLENYKELIKKFYKKTTNNITKQAYKRILDSSDKQIPNLGKNTSFKTLFKID